MLKRIVLSLLAVVMVWSTCYGMDDQTTVLYKDVPIVDVNKIGAEDSNMCWAAIATNMMVYALGGNANTVYAQLRSNFKNTPNSVYTAISWYLKAYQNVTDAQLAWVCDAYNDKIPANIKDWIRGALLQQEIVSISMMYPVDGSSHGITVYAYEISNGKRYIVYADSDDQFDGLKRGEIQLRNGYWWFVGGYLDGYRIDGAMSFKMRHVMGD